MALDLTGLTPVDDKDIDWSQYKLATPTPPPQSPSPPALDLKGLTPVDDDQIDWSKYKLVDTPHDPNAEPMAPNRPSLDQQQQLYNLPDYAPVQNSPIDRNWYANHPEATNAEVPTAMPQQVQETIAHDVTDNTRNVSFLEAAKRYAEIGATKTVGILSGATSFLGYPITALDAAISGRAIPSAAETVSQAEEPFEAEQKAYELNPETEKLTLGGKVGAAVGTAASQLPLMYLTGGASGVEQGAVALAEEAFILANMATKLLHSAKASLIPAATDAQQIAKQTIDQGGTPEEAFNAALKSAEETVVFNTLPMAAKGGLATRVATGAGMGAATGAAQAYLNDQPIDLGDVVSGAVTGAALAGLMGERASPRTVAEKASARVQDLSDQVINSAEVLKTQAARGEPAASGIVEADNMLKQAEAGQIPKVPTEMPANISDLPASTEQPAISQKPAVSVEEKGNRVLFRGDLDQIRSALDQADIPPGMVKIEKGEPVGMYFPPSYKERVSTALKVLEDSHENAPLASEETSNPRPENGQDATLAPEIQYPRTEGVNNGDAISRVQPDINREKLNAPIKTPEQIKQEQIDAAYRQRDVSKTQQENRAFANKEQMDALGEHYQDYYDKLDSQVGKYPSKFHAEGEEVPQGLNESDARKALEKEWGKTAVSKMERNGLQLVSREAIAHDTPELTNAQRAGVKGYTPADKSSAVVVHDNNSAEELAGTVIHEVWHANADQILPAQQKTALSKAVESLASRSPEIKAAIDRIPKGTSEGHRADEILAYAMQDLYHQPIGKSIMNAVKLGLNRTGVPLHWINAHEAAIREIGVQNLRHFTHSENTRSYLGNTGAGFIHTTTPNDLETPSERVESGNQFVTELPKGQIPANVPEVMHQEQSQKSRESRDVSTQPQTRLDQPVEPEIPGTGQNEKNVPLQEGTSIKNQTVTEERADRGRQQIEVEGKRAFGDVWEAAKQRLDQDPGYGQELAKSVIADPRPLKAEDSAALLHDRVRLNNSYDDVMSRIEEAIASKDQKAELSARYRLEAIQDALDLNDQASQIAGYEQGLGLAVRGMMALSDYSLTRTLRRAKVALGENVPKSVQSKLEHLTQQLKEKEDQIAALSQAKTPRKKGVPRDKKVVQNEFDQIRAELARIAGKKPTPEPTKVMYSREDINRLSPEEKTLIRRLAKNRIEAGVDGGEALVNEVHSAIDGVIDLSPRDVRDLISDYGKERTQTKDEIQQKINGLKSELRALSKTEDIASGKLDPNAQKNKTRQTQLKKQIEDLSQQLKTGNFEKPKKEPPIYNEETYKLRIERDRTKAEIEKQIRKLELANRSNPMKTVDFVNRVRRAMILSGSATIGKLSAAALIRMASTPVEEMIGSVLKHVPGLRNVAKLATREGRGFNWEAEKTAFTRTFSKDTLDQMKKVLFTHKSDIDVLYGKDMYSPHDILELPGQIHAMLKTPAKQNEFFRSVVHESLSEKERVKALGMTPEQIQAHMEKQSTQDFINAKAFANSQRAILMGENVAVDAYKAMKNALERSGVFGTAISKALDFEMPIVKVPANLVAEIGSYSIGSAKALARYLFRGTKELSQDQADYIMRNLKKQTLGLALLALGFYAKGTFGGLYQPGKKDPNAPEYGEAQFGDTSIGKWAFHTPVTELLQIGATLRRVYDKEHSMGEAGFEVGKDIVSEIPFFSAPARLGKALVNPKEAVKYAGQELRSFIPPDIQRFAKSKDSRTINGKQVPVDRKPKNFLQEIEMGIPGLRENVPTRH